MVRPEKKRRAAVLQGEEEEVLLDEMDVEDEEEPHTNGVETGTEYVETSNEDEMLELISNVDDKQEELVDVPEWKIKILCCGLTTAEHTQIIKQMQQSNNDITKLYSNLIILGCRHPVTHKRIFQPAHRGLLDRRTGKATERLAMTIMRLSGLDPEFLDTLKKK